MFLTMVETQITFAFFSGTQQLYNCLLACLDILTTLMLSQDKTRHFYYWFEKPNKEY